MKTKENKTVRTVYELAAPIAEKLGLILWDIRFTKEGSMWILSIIIIAVWLIVVEFIHNNLQEQQKIAGMSFDEMLEKFRGKEKE